MSNTESEPLQPLMAEFRTPEQEQAEAGRDVPEAQELALEEIKNLSCPSARRLRVTLGGAAPLKCSYFGVAPRGKQSDQINHQAGRYI